MAVNKVKQKSYNIKVYSLAGVFLQSINPNSIMTGVAFTSQINGGQGELRIKIRAALTSTIVSYNNIIRVYETDDVAQTPRLIYTGIVWSLQRISDGTGDYIEVRSVGIASMLSWVFFQSGGLYAFNKSQELAQTMRNIVDHFATLYPGIISYSIDSLQDTGITGTTLAFSYDKCIDAIRKVADTGTYWWYIWEDGLLQYHPKTGALLQTTHRFTFWEDIDSITIDENIEQMANRYIVKWSSGVSTANDIPSQTANGIREGYEDHTTDIIDSPTGVSWANSQLAKRKDLQKKITIQINDNYDIETIKPGDLVTVCNTDYDITALQINKIEYNTDNVKVELEGINSFTSELYL